MVRGDHHVLPPRRAARHHGPQQRHGTLLLDVHRDEWSKRWTLGFVIIQLSRSRNLAHAPTCLTSAESIRCLLRIVLCIMIRKYFVMDLKESIRFHKTPD